MILVTGATGILGRVIVLELLKRGLEVRAAKRKSSDTIDVLKSYHFYTDDAQQYFDKIQWIDIDFDDLFSVESALVGITEVYHCAGLVSFHPKDRKSLYHTNIEGTRQLLIACENSAVRKFCFVSSTAVLDGVDEEGKVTEDSNYNPKLAHSAYSVSKHFSEMEVWRASAEGLQTVIINPGVIIGSGNWNGSSGQIFETFSKYPYVTSGSTAYVDVRDVAKIATTLMDKNIFDERFILVSENIKTSRIAEFIRQKLGKSLVRILPFWLLKAGSVLNFLFGWLFPGLRLLNKVNITTVTSNFFVSNKKIKNRLDYEFIPVMESLDFHFNNYLSNHQ